MYYPFNEKELKITGYTHAVYGNSAPNFSYPVSAREEFRNAILHKKPLWQNAGVEIFRFFPDILPDNRARGSVNDGGVRIPDEEKGGLDMFGIEWVYVPVVGGSMEKPGQTHLFDDVNDWKGKVVFPNIESWDWEGSAKLNKEFLNNGKFNYVILQNGFGFERLISFMGFENAAMALLDEEQHDALHELLDALSDLYCKLVDKFCIYYDIDGFDIHDDWGSQRAPFFSPEIGREFFVPYMKKVTDHIHSHGKVADLHSCGANMRQIENYIAAGFDLWSPMPNINDTEALYQQYGDRIVIGVAAPEYDSETETEEQIRKKARDFVEQHCSTPGKVCIINHQTVGRINGIFAEELYKASRIKLAERYSVCQSE